MGDPNLIFTWKQLADCRTQEANVKSFTFDRRPKDPCKGFVFGSIPNLCDVSIGTKGDGISGRHFSISLDEQGRVVLKNISSVSLRVSYNGEGGYQRKRFKWIIFTEIPQITVRVRKLAFRIEAVEHDNCQTAYQTLLKSYLEDSQTALSLDLLDVQSQTLTAQPTGQRLLDGEENPIYLKKELLGCGGFGAVHRIIDVSTGFEYAGKRFHKPLEDSWRSEIEILRVLSHEHIVQYVSYTEEAGPMLAMEYLPMGNLEEEQERVSITIQETAQLCHQLLLALDYLQTRPRNLTHRDIKPANVLFYSRFPFHVKLSDFGLAKYGSLKTQCGTPFYMAPEVHDHRPYTSAVDIWSLGVILLEYGYGIHQRFTEGLGGKARCLGIIRALDTCEHDVFLQFISSNMLRMDPRERSSARECLERMVNLNLLGSDDFESGIKTPTRREVLPIPVASMTRINPAITHDSSSEQMKVPASGEREETTAPGRSVVASETDGIDESRLAQSAKRPRQTDDPPTHRPSKRLRQTLANGRYVTAGRLPGENGEIRLAQSAKRPRQNDKPSPYKSPKRLRQTEPAASGKHLELLQDRQVNPIQRPSLFGSQQICSESEKATRREDNEDDGGDDDEDDTEEVDDKDDEDYQEDEDDDDDDDDVGEEV